ncbi:transcription factor MYB3R-2-like isoform X2 [Magnolia sinica]|uniref:transcription factor MYB3R-2-like isoform X2 n=1 Tax=Magnolia sinica TaxID=86752 RepID=UPI002658D91D|nr:transcription factor MYB3R-2-like isoform X2 [Magnolia sinica]
MDGVKKETDAEVVNEGAMASNSSVSESSIDTVLPKISSIPGTTGPTRRSTKGGWTEMEDDALTKAVKIHNAKNWKKIAESFPGRSDVQCLHRWQKVLNPDLIKGPWTKEEDDCIIELVEKYGCKKWSVIAQSLPGRIGKQCRERWHNHLNPAIKKDAWTKEEEVILIRAHQTYGNKWAEIARFLPGRADNSIKNHWNCSVKKRLDSYLTPGLLGQLPGSGALDLYNHVKEEKNVVDEIGQQNTASIISLDQKPYLKFGAETCSLVSALGNESGSEQHSDNERRQMEISKCLKLEVNDLVKSKNATPHDRNATLLLYGPVSVIRGDGADTSNDWHVTAALQSKSSPSLGDGESLHSQVHDLEPADITNTNLSLGPPGHIISVSYSPSLDLGTNVPVGSTICSNKKRNSSEMVPSVATKEMLDSCVTLRQYATARNSLADLAMRLSCEATNTSTSNSPECEFGNNLETSINKSPGTPSRIKNATFGALCYEPPQLTTLDASIGNGQFANDKRYIQQAQSPVSFSTPQYHPQSKSGSGNSPESILRSAARSFKNTPSILRKRVRETLRLLPAETCQKAALIGSNNDVVCTPEARDQSYDNISGSACSCLHGSSEDRNFTEVLNVKRLFPSPPQSLKTKSATTAAKSLEKRLEHAFDLEWANASTKYNTSTTASDPSNAVPSATAAFMSLDKSDDSRARLKRQKFMMLGSSVNCST